MLKYKHNSIKFRVINFLYIQTFKLYIKDFGKIKIKITLKINILNIKLYNI